MSLADRTWPLVRPLLFRMDAEDAHELTLRALSAAPVALGRVARLAVGRVPDDLGRDVAGLRFPLP
ncbi:MAG: hypothetical protein KC621_33545, partial [Myxococcales bacterium]|nr:hypothetical protein [Myxococcales bacterium]